MPSNLLNASVPGDPKLMEEAPVGKSINNLLVSRDSIPPAQRRRSRDQHSAVGFVGEANTSLGFAAPTTPLRIPLISKLKWTKQRRP
ncbi:hypothetical protein RRG08_007075 [Elysia crispata]|uniref:Uncharacterized protein n=1 Tax=Elysia crispata TaxID=231223 RepID=A0AAE0YNQ4_9GAST|nr:hypothetical protein RRG08_007075 [Elysia crispata]